MTTAQTFSYEGIFSERSQDTAINVVRHARYDFAVAYPAPETSPMDGLVQALQTAMDTRGDEIAREMAAELDVPLEVNVSFGPNWAEAK